MLYLFTGTDRKKARVALDKAVQKATDKKREVVRITDANSLEDLRAVLQGSGMFDSERTVVLDGILSNEEMRAAFLDTLPMLAKSSEDVFLYEEKLDAPTRKVLEKHAEKSERFDLVKRAERGGGIFVLANALQRGDKKALWVEYQRALARDEVPEAIHGVLFWGAKNMFLRSPERGRGAKFVAELAELPHEARRQGVELEYALERYILGINIS